VSGYWSCIGGKIEEIVSVVKWRRLCRWVNGEVVSVGKWRSCVGKMELYRWVNGGAVSVDK
jgi:hypothetical protein